MASAIPQTHLHDLLDCTRTASLVAQAARATAQARGAGARILSREEKRLLADMTTELDAIQTRLQQLASLRRIEIERAPHLVNEPATEGGTL